MSNPLFQPFECGALRLANRVVMAPMTRKRSPGGTPGDDVAAYYRRRAQGGVGLIVTEGVAIERPGAKAHADVPDMFGAAMPGWAKVVDQVHDADCAIAPQLWHVGARPDDQTGAHPLGTVDSPSGMPWPGLVLGEPMSEEDIADTIAAFAAAAAAARATGFDAVELHGANGYLIDQFFWDATNLRRDRWGGSIDQRSRFAAELIRAVRKVSGDAPVTIRISQDKSPDGSIRLANSPAELAAWLEPLVDAGVGMFHCSGPRYSRAEFPDSTLSFAGWVKKITGRPTITVGSVGLAIENGPASYSQPVPVAPLDDLLARLDRGEFDLVAVGRALLADPCWAEKVRDGRDAELLGFNVEAVRSFN